MSNLFHDVPLWNEDLTEINAIIEIPKDSMIKYEFDINLNAIKVNRIWRTPIPYLFNYWFLTQSWNKDDNDPLDVIVLCRFSFTPWCIVPVRVIWGLKVIDWWENDYKIIAVANDKYYDKISDINQLQESEKEDIYYFMQRYKDLHKKSLIIDGWDTKENSLKILKESQLEYNKKFK